MALKRWSKLNKVFIVCVLLIIVFAWMDAKQIVAFYNSDNWDLYAQHTAPAILGLWYYVLISVGLIWFIVSDDASEALGLVAASFTMLLFGLEDVFFFLFSCAEMTPCMSWFGFPINIVSRLLGETCVSPLALFLNATLGVFIAYILFNQLKRQKGW